MDYPNNVFYFLNCLYKGRRLLRVDIFLKDTSFGRAIEDIFPNTNFKDVLFYEVFKIKELCYGPKNNPINLYFCMPSFILILIT